MKKFILFFLICGILVFVLTAAVLAFDANKALQGKMTWEEIVAAAKEEGEVTFYGWGGSAITNQWVDNYFGKELEERYGIKLIRVPMNIDDIINKLLAEKQAGKKVGIIDTVWINGENFKTAYQANLLWGSYAKLLPNYNKYCKPKEANIDFGFDNQGFESPYSNALFVFGYDAAKTEPFNNFDELKKFVKKNSGRFTYSAPPDFYGSAFVRQVFCATTGGYEQWLGDFNREKFEAKVQATWDYLNEIEPYLWRNGKTYPESNAKLESLFQMGEIDITMNYSFLAIQSYINQGKIPPTCKSFILDEGVLSNMNYITISGNSSHKAAALVLANLMMDPEVQISKLDPKKRGDGIGIDISLLEPKYVDKLENVDLGPATLPMDFLYKNRIFELNAKYTEAIEQGWIENVLKK